MIKVLVFDFFNVLLVSRGLKFELNEELLDFLSRIKDKYPLYIFTNSKSLPTLPAIKKQLDPIFREVFFASDLNLNKDASVSYQKLAQVLSLPAQQLFFTDDNQNNVQAAQDAGWQAVHFQSTSQLLDHLNKILDLPDKISP